MLLMFANICVKRNIRQDTVLVAVTKNQKNSSLNKGKVCFSVAHSLGVSSPELTQKFESVRGLNSYLVTLSVLNPQPSLLVEDDCPSLHHHAHISSNRKEVQRKWRACVFLVRTWLVSCSVNSLIPWLHLAATEAEKDHLHSGCHENPSVLIFST